MSVNDKMAKEIASKLKSTIAKMPSKLKNLPPELQADMNRLSQLALKNGDILGNDGKVNIDKLMNNNAAMSELEAKIRTKDYGIHTGK